MFCPGAAFWSTRYAMHDRGHTAFLTECGQLFLTGQWLHFRSISTFPYVVPSVWPCFSTQCGLCSSPFPLMSFTHARSWGFEALPTLFRILNRTFGSSKYREAIVASSRSPYAQQLEGNDVTTATGAIPPFLRMGVWDSLTPVRVDTVEKGGATRAPGRGEGRVQRRKQSLVEMGVRHVACSGALTAIVTGLAWSGRGAEGGTGCRCVYVLSGTGHTDITLHDATQMEVRCTAADLIPMAR